MRQAGRRGRGGGPDADVLLRLVRASANVGLLRFDRGGTILELDEASARMLGGRRGELEGRAASELLPDLDLARIAEAGEGTQGPREFAVRRADGGEGWIKANLHALFAEGTLAEVLVIATDISSRKHLESSVDARRRGIATTAGGEFFQALVQHLARVLGMDAVLIGELEEGAARVRSVAAWFEGSPASFSYPLEGTPCEGVMQGSPCVHSRGVRELYPRDEFLARNAMESYVGTPLFDSAGAAIGLLVAAHREELADPELAASTMTIFAARAAAELERERAQAELLALQARLELQNEALIRLSGSRSLERGDLADTLREITEEGARTLEVERAGVWLFEGDRSRLVCADLYDRSEHSHEHGIELAVTGSPDYVRALEAGRCIDARDARCDPRTRELGDSHYAPRGVRSTLDAPIRLGGRVVGVVCHEDCGEPRRWTTDEQHFAASLADLVTLALEASQRRRAQQDLRMRNRELAALHRISEVTLSSRTLGEALAQIAGEVRSACGLAEVAVELRGRGGEAPARFESGRGSGEGVAAVRDRAAVPISAGAKVLGTLAIARQGGRPSEDPLEPLAGRLAGALATAIERLRSREQRALLEEQLRQSQKLEALGTLAGGVAHDFNNLLTGILGYAFLLRESHGEDPEVGHAALVIETAAQRAAELTQQLLGFARQGKHQDVPVDLHALVREVVELLRRTVDKRIALRLELEAPSAVVMGDPGQLHQAILNLAINARDAMPQGGEIRFTTRALAPPELPAEAAELPRLPAVCLAVEDTGVGIEPDVLPRIFDPFFTTKGPGEGSGMGLAVVYGILQGHGGSIGVTSAPGAGATFRVFLPLAPRAAPRPAAAPGREPKADLPANVLVVDDEELVRATAVDLLRCLGCKVVAAESGEEAIRLFGQLRGSIDLVVLDLAMPGMDGRECLRALRAIDPDVPVLLSSGWQRSLTVQEALAEGASGFLDKPYALQGLADALRRVKG